MIKSLVFLSVLAISVSAYAGEKTNSLKKSEATISRLENKQVHMLARILHKKGRGMIDQKFNDEQKLAKQSFSKSTHTHLLEEVNSDKYQN